MATLIAIAFAFNAFRLFTNFGGIGISRSLICLRHPSPVCLVADTNGRVSQMRREFHPLRSTSGRAKWTGADRMLILQMQISDLTATICLINLPEF
jgi:hypothetical protein